MNKFNAFMYILVLLTILLFSFLIFSKLNYKIKDGDTVGIEITALDGDVEVFDPPRSETIIMGQTNPDYLKEEDLMNKKEGDQISFEYKFNEELIVSEEQTIEKGTEVSATATIISIDPMVETEEE